MDLHKVSYPAFLPRPIFSLTPSPFHLLQWLTPATLSSRLVPPSSGTIPPTHRRRTMGLTKGTLVTATTTLTRHRLRPLTTAQMFNMPAIMGARRCHHRRQRPPQALHTPSPQPTLMGPTRRDTLATRQEPNRRDLTIHGNTPHHIRIRRRTNTRIHTPDLVLNLKGTTTIPPLMTRSLRRLATTNKSLYPLPCPWLQWHTLLYPNDPSLATYVRFRSIVNMTWRGIGRRTRARSPSFATGAATRLSRGRMPLSDTRYVLPDLLRLSKGLTIGFGSW